VSALEETADIPGRGLHFCVLEGVNGGASINFHAANVIAGVPDSNNAFISSGGKSDAVYDYSQVNSMLTTFKHTYPRAFTGAGAAIASMALKEWFELEGFAVQMAALNFKKIGKAIKKTMKDAKRVRANISDIADIAQPIMQEGGAILASGAFGPTGQAVGAGMLAGSAGIDKARRYGVLEK